MNKEHLPSRHATSGPERAPHRAFYYAMGLTAEQIAQMWSGNLLRVMREVEKVAAELQRTAK